MRKFKGNAIGQSVGFIIPSIAKHAEHLYRALWGAGKTLLAFQPEERKVSPSTNSIASRYTDEHDTTGKIRQANSASVGNDEVAQALWFHESVARSKDAGFWLGPLIIEHRLLNTDTCTDFEALRGATYSKARAKWLAVRLMPVLGSM